MTELISCGSVTEADDDLRWKDYTLKGHVVTLEGNFDMNTRKDTSLDTQ